MTEQLLTTKLYIPLLGGTIVPRPRLIEKLDAGLTQKLTLVSAQAGFGKTTLIADWVCRLAREIAWVSLDEDDNDPVLFLRYLIAALQQVNGDIGRGLLQSLPSSGFAPLTDSEVNPSLLAVLVTQLINDIVAANTASVLVLDDYHYVHSPLIHRILQLLLEHQLAMMHVVLITREDPPLPLARLRVRRQVNEIRERDLRFSLAEVTSFLDKAADESLPPEAASALESRTEGWIAGLQLATLALQKKLVGANTFVNAFRGDDRYVVDYLVTEVLQRQPEDLREFLCQTAILDRMTAPLCDAVTGNSGSQAMLERLDKANLFLVPLDHHREWFRYHRLFADSLRTRLAEDSQAALHRRALQWYAGQHLMSPAIQHALVYAGLTADYEPAERLITTAASQTIHHGETRTLGAWLEALPEARIKANGVLATYKAWDFILLGDMSGAEAYILTATACFEERVPSGAELGRLLALQSFVAVLVHQDYAGALAITDRALEVLVGSPTSWLLIALWARAESLERLHRIPEAVEILEDARSTCFSVRNHILAGLVETSLIKLLNDCGRRQEAVSVCEDAISRYTDATGHISAVAGIILVRLGHLHYEADALEAALGFCEQGIELASQLGLGYDLSFSKGLAAPVIHALGDSEVALTYLRDARKLAIQTHYADVAWFVAWEANIHLLAGDVLFAVRWVEREGLSPEDPLQFLRLEQHIIYARYLVTQRLLPEARRWLKRLEEFMRANSLDRWLITVYILQALTAELAGEPAARDRLAQALQLAAPEGYVRAFLDEDARILDVLPGLRHIAPEFVDQLLGRERFATVRVRGVPVTPSTAQPLIDPLSERELEVLRLLAQGLSNKEIAQTLFIAVGTVKQHLKSIYSKLDVHNRTEASKQAWTLGLL